MGHTYFRSTDKSRWMFRRCKLIKHERVPLSTILDFIQLVPKKENPVLYDSQHIMSILAKWV